MIFKAILKILKTNIIVISIMSLIIVMMVIGSCATVPRATLQDRTMYISTGLRSTWAHQTFDMQTGYFSTFGRHARLITDAMGCATLRIDGLVSPLWRLQKWSTLQQQLRIQDLGFFLKVEPMLRRCSRIRWYPSPLITRSFSNLSRTVWNAQRRNSRTRYRQGDSLVIRSVPQPPPPMRYRMDWTPQLTGRTRGTIHTTGRNYNSSSTTNQVNGRGRTTSSITGGLRKRVSASGRK